MDQENPGSRKRERRETDGEDFEETKVSMRNVARRDADNDSGPQAANNSEAASMSAARAQQFLLNNPNLSQLPLGHSTVGAETTEDGGGVPPASAAAAQSLGPSNLFDSSQLLSQQGLNLNAISSLPQPSSQNPTIQSLAALNMLSSTATSPTPTTNFADALRNIAPHFLTSESRVVNALLQRTSTDTAPDIGSALQLAPRNQQTSNAVQPTWDANTILQLAMARNQAPTNLLASTGSVNPLLENALLNAALNNPGARGVNPFLLQRLSVGQTSQPSTAAAASLSLAGHGATQLQQQNPLAALSLLGLTNPTLGLFNLAASGLQERVVPPVAEAPLGGAPAPSFTTSQSSGGEASLTPAAASGVPSATSLSSQSTGLPQTAAAAAMAQQQEQEVGPPTPSDSNSILLYTPNDDTKISPYQCLARQQLEFFVVGQDDLEAGAQGRNRPIVLGQVGIRCRHCAQIPHRQKQRASTYFPAKLSGVYQTAQNITNSHLCQLCHCIPASIRRDLQLLQSKKSGTGGGRRYWTESAEACGVYEIERGGLRLRRDLGDTEGG